MAQRDQGEAACGILAQHICRMCAAICMRLSTWGEPRPDGRVARHAAGVLGSEVSVRTCLHLFLQPLWLLCAIAPVLHHCFGPSWPLHAMGFGEGMVGIWRCSPG